MEEEELREYETTYETTITLESQLLMAEAGDRESLQFILYFFEEEINHLAKYIKMPKDDAIQSLKLELIDYTLRKKERPLEQEIIKWR